MRLDLLFGLLPVTIDGSIVAKPTPNGVATTVAISVPPHGYDTPYSNGGTAAQLPAAALEAASVSVGSLSLGQATAVLNAVATTIVTPIVNGVNGTILGPVSDLVGLRTADADVLLLDHPTCTSPVLRG
ncbi:hypothetical protein [Nocardioides sp. T2.26MG-1]|uniref:hypothetical protein n=1 Tax=Nocardioides sp. T2.26MG-1 TaxID=3041166 RepID=UPI00253F6C77|nr:hypothetical protein [Nocardioides sp. T2.26MG-1]